MRVLGMTFAPRTRGRKARGYSPVRTVKDVLGMMADDLLHLNKWSVRGR
jgi:hypothetical protein